LHGKTDLDSVWDVYNDSGENNLEDIDRLKVFADKFIPILNSNITPVSFSEDEEKKRNVLDNDISLDFNKSKSSERRKSVAASRRRSSLAPTGIIIERNVLNVMPTLRTEQELNALDGDVTT
jgi:hypothetical protein